MKTVKRKSARRAYRETATRLAALEKEDVPPPVPVVPEREDDDPPLKKNPRSK